MKGSWRFFVGGGHGVATLRLALGTFGGPLLQFTGRQWSAALALESHRDC